MRPSGIYIDLWTRKRGLILDNLKLATTKQFFKLTNEEFEAVGNRKKYSFNLELRNGNVSNNISDSAVARDLARILQDSSDIYEILLTGHYKINLDKDFYLWIERK
ncbi:hypothetical protein [Labilibaculum euxinus]